MEHSGLLWPFKSDRSQQEVVSSDEQANALGVQALVPKIALNCHKISYCIGNIFRMSTISNHRQINNWKLPPPKKNTDNSSYFISVSSFILQQRGRTLQEANRSSGVRYF